MVIAEQNESKILRESNMYQQQAINKTYCQSDKTDLAKIEAETEEDSIYKLHAGKVI